MENLIDICPIIRVDSDLAGEGVYIRVDMDVEPYGVRMGNGVWLNQIEELSGDEGTFYFPLEIPVPDKEEMADICFIVRLEAKPFDDHISFGVQLDVEPCGDGYQTGISLNQIEDLSWDKATFYFPIQISVTEEMTYPVEQD
jgi:hypothetical protein